MKVAVFGHYDSRGGTMAIPIPDDPTFQDLADAHKRYDLEVMCIPEDELSDCSLYPEPPSVEDYLFIADLHGDIELGIDLDNGTRSVLIDESTEEAGGMNFVQLEAVTMPEGFDADIKAHEKGVCEQRSVLCNGYSFSSKWTPEQAAHGTQLDNIEKGLQAERESRIVAAAKTLKGESVKYRRWDDDAFGFIVLKPKEEQGS